MSKKINGNDENKFQNILNKSKISKIITSITTTDNPKYLFESLNKLFLNQQESKQFLINLFSMKEKKDENKIIDDNNKISLKLKELLYFLIINFNFKFFNNFVKENQLVFDEEKFINDCLMKSIELISNRSFNNYGNNNILFHKYFIIIIFFILKYKYKKEYNKHQIETIVKCFNNSELNDIFFDIYTTSLSLLNSNDTKKSIFELNFFKKYDFINKLINNYSSNKNSIYIFSINDINNFCLFINKHKYKFLFQSNYIEPKNNIEQKNILNNSDDVLYLSSLKSIKEKLNLLLIETNKLAKILFYGEKCGGKTTLAKEILNNPLIIDIDESLETNYLLGEYLINEFSEIIWQDGILLSALKQGKDILLLSMEKSGNDFICILKQILENNSLFIPSKQETLYGFNSKIVMIYNITNTNDIKKLMSTNPLFNFLSSNSYSFYFKSYNNDEIMNICKFKYGLNKQEINIFNKLINIYNSIPLKFKINTRYKFLSLNNILHNAKLLHDFFIKNNLIGDINNEEEKDNENIIFINERLMMNLVSLFIYNNLLTIENMILLKSITELYATEFNFNFDSFNNVIFNLEEKYTFNNSEYNYIKTFEGNKIFYDEIPKGDFYSYNTNSKFYIKLINESIINNNNILLVGETGVGKTRMIQNLAKLMNNKLNVINMSQSSDEGDLLGGFKPVSTKNFLKKYFDKILNILNNNFNAEKNQIFIQSLYKAYDSLTSVSNVQKELYFVKFSIGSLKKLKDKIIALNNDKNINTLNEIDILMKELTKFMQQLNKNGNRKNSFKYLEGILLQSIKNDEWILLDEINLASDNILLKLKSILEGNSIFIMNNNKINEYHKKNKFRIFGSMNPEYNIGKKRLPSEIREFFSELFINEITSTEDINNFIKEYLQDLPQINDTHIKLISNFYLEIKKLQKNNQILKPNKNKTNFSLRTLTRALVTIRNGLKIFKKTETAIYESLSMNFISQIDNSSKNLLPIKYEQTQLNLAKEIISKEKSTEKNSKKNFILTPMFIKHLETLIQIVTLSEYAVLLEGPTSCGKTSIVEFLAQCMNQKILRINNNQNTEVEEYLGSYTTDKNGNFYFNEGFLVKAVKEGFWIILDEINLAPSEVLEALNRLLDDNRELYLPESNTVIKAHKNFRIFAAMNPSETYVGRKDLSDAFKNRFIHLFFNNIPNKELINIIQQRCELPLSRTEIMINIFSDLQMIRSQDKIFQKNEGFITIRDLIKWGSRDIDSYEKLAIEGFILLGEKLSNNEDKEMVRKVIEKNLKQKKIKLDNDTINNYYTYYVQNKFLQNEINNISNIKFTKSIERIITLVDKAITNHEAVLLIGDTGVGKTLSIEYISNYYKRKLTTINCHENMDTNDFLGSLKSCMNSNNNNKSIFEWVDGPITSAMKEGHIVVLDEIALVMDSVLERMNSIFETDSVLVLSEKNINDNVEIIRPNKNFCIIGTICPSSLEGKKELSQALRARFTEIYIPKYINEDIYIIIEYKIKKIKYLVEKNLEQIYTKILYELYIYYNELQEINKPMSFRDVDIICEFIIKKCEYNIKNRIENNEEIIQKIFYQSIQMVIIEGLYLNESLSPELLSKLKEYILNKFTKKNFDKENLILIDNEKNFGINDFILDKKVNGKNKMQIEKDDLNNNDNHEFIFDTETLKNNLLKIIRGMFIKKPILIEGSPGIGKTTIVQNLAKKLNKKIHRVNLSEHTDMIDLIGSQFPTSDNNIKFKWIDGVLLTAMKNGDWIIIDEMNLANQSILEGLNSILDEKQCLFVPELNKEIKAHPEFQIFATQNPVYQGGGRKFLPKNFLNRFIKIYLDELNINDYEEILEKIFIGNNNDLIKKDLINNLVLFNEEVKNEIKKNKISLNEVGEFNLRTMIKFLNTYKLNKYNLFVICNTFYLSRIRNFDIKKSLFNKFIQIFYGNENKDNNIDMNTYLKNSNNYFDEIKLCIENNYPIIISGEGSIGKKHLIKSMFLNDNKNNLNSFYLYSTMDSSELLGNFDKSNNNYQLNQYITELKLKNENNNNIINLIEKIEKQKIFLEEKTEKNNNEYNFEWHDSILINSIMNGDMIILDNANTCNSAVLDRLNSLLDDDKKIYLNESGENRIIQPNKKFRIFLTMNPLLGEVSRALKNRCVELYYTGHKIIFDKNGNNNFNVKGNFNNIKINLFEFGKIDINTNLFFDLMKMSELPFYNSFDIFIIYFIKELEIILNDINDNKNKKGDIFPQDIKFNFSKYMKYISLIKNYMTQGYNINQCINNALYIIDNNLENDLNKISLITEKYINLIHDYFLQIFDSKQNINRIFNESINFQIFLLYHFNIIYNSKYELNRDIFIKNLEDLLDINRNIIKYNEKNTKNRASDNNNIINNEELISLFNSNSFLFNNNKLLLNYNNNNIILSLFNIITFLESNKYEVDILFSILNIDDNNNNNEISLSNEIKKYFKYSYDKLNIGNLTKYSLNTILNIESMINQFQKIIDYNYESDLLQIFKETIDNKIKLIEKNELIDYKYFFITFVKLSFLNNILSDESNKLFIRQNSDIFIYIIKKIFGKFHNIFYNEKNEIKNKTNINILIKHISKIKLKMTKNFYENCLVVYNNINEFNLNDKYISVITFSYDSKNCQFNLKIPLNKNYLNKLFKEIVINTNIQSSIQNRNQGLLPYVNSNEQLTDINSLIQLLLNSSTYINESIYSIINRLFSYDTINEDYNNNLIDLILNNSQILDNKNIYIFIKNINEINNENENDNNYIIIKNICYDLVKIIIIDEYKTNVINKIYAEFNKNLIVSNIEELIKENKILLYIYPYIYFYIQNNINNIDNIYDAIELIEKFDMNKYIELIIKKYEKIFNIDFSQILTEFKPTKDKIYKILSKNFINKFNQFKEEANNKFNFAYELVNHKSLSYKVNKEKYISNIDRNSDTIINLENKNIDSLINNDEIKTFTIDIDRILQGQTQAIMKEELIKFISKYIIKFNNIILPYAFFIYITSIQKEYKANNNINTLKKNVNNSENYNEEYKLELINEYNKCIGDKKIEYLIYKLNKYNKDIIKNIYFEYYNQKKLEIKNLNQNKKIKIKKYLSLNEKVMENSNVIGAIKKEEKEKMEKENENKEIKEYFPTYENEIDIFHTNDNNNEINNDTNKIEQKEEIKINYIKSFILLSKMNLIENNEMSLLLNQNDISNNINSDEFNEIESYLQLLESNDTNSITQINNIEYYYNKLIINSTNTSNTKKYIHDLICYYISSLNSSNNFASSSLSLLNENNNKISINNNSSSSVSYNFYKSPSPKNILMLYYPINMLITKCQKYFEKYPNHPTIINILFVCNTILSLDINTTPLSKVLSILDILITNIHEWEQYASRSINSLYEEQTLIMKLVRYYRFVEIQSWKNFLASKEKTLIEEELNEYFEYLIDLIIEHNNKIEKKKIEKEKIEEKHSLLDTLNVFLLSSNLGNFVIRLNEVKIIADLTNNNLVKNLYSYYYINYIQNNKFQKYKKEKIDEIFYKIKSLIKINKFDIRNYLNFRDNMRRNYKQLNKLLKQNENLYSENDLNTIIINEQKEEEKKEYIEIFVNENVNRVEKKNVKNNVFSENFYSVLHRMKTLFDLKKNINANYKQKFILDIIKKLQSMGLSKNYKYFQKKVFEKIMGLKLEKNNIESSYLCKILNKINNYMNIPEGKITRELNMNYIERMKGLIVSFFDKCLEINGLLLNIKENKRKLVINKYIALINQDKDEDMNLDNEEKYKIDIIINSCNNFLMNFNFKDFKLIYYSDEKKKNDANNRKFIEYIQSLSMKIENIIKYLNEIDNNYEIFYVIVCFIGIKNIAEKIKNYLQKEFRIIKYLYEDKLSDIIRLINEFISRYDISNINEEYQEIYYEDQIDSVLDNYNENIDKNNLEKDIIYINSKFIEKLFIKDDLAQNNNNLNNNEDKKEKDNINANNTNLFNDKIQNIEDNLDDLITNLTNLNKSLISYGEKSPLLYNPLSFNEKDLNLLYIDILQFCNICTTIFYSITINGLGKSDQDENPNQNKNPEDGAVYEGGYGMSGDGQGMENITKQIEDEEQLLGLRDENNDNNNENDNDENKQQDDAFEMKTDFKEDYNKEMNEDENGEKKENENSDIEREEDSVDNNDNNKMGDKDVQDDLSEENQDENKKKKKIDLTDKNVQIEQDNKNNKNDYKEGDDEKSNEKNENVDEDNQQQNETDNDKNDSNSDNSEEEGEKIEKLEVDKNKEKEKEKKEENKENNNNEENENENKEEQMEIEEEIEKEDNNIKQEEKNKNENPLEDNQEDNEDLIPENKDKNEINNDNDNEEEEINSEKNEENSNNSSEDENNKSMKLDEEIIDKEENKEKEEEKIISNPISNPEKDLGYNPLTKNKNTQGNNTAKNTKNSLNELNDEENKDNDIDFDQLENLNQFKEIFDINSVLNNVYKKGQIENQRNKKNKENNMNIEHNNNPIEELNEKDQIMDNDFKFENYEDKNENNNNGLDNDDNFEMGYGSNNKNDNDKIAKEKNKENNHKIKNENINKQEINKMNQEEESENSNEINDDEDKKEGIKVIEDIEKNEQIKEKKEMNKSEENMEEEEDENASKNNEQNEIEEIEEKEEDIIQQNKTDDLFPKEDNKTDFDKNLIINTELKLSEKEVNEQAISIFNNYLESSQDKNISQSNISNSNNLEQFFNSLLTSSQNQIIKLTSLLKTVLTPNLQSKLVGNYKTGKRLNMKKIISFIASNYRQDKIWLRRTLPYNRDYYITISIDNSLSMKQNNIGYYALQSMLILVKSLQKVGIDNLSLFGITDDCVELYDYNIEKSMINNEKIKNILNYFKFNFESKNSFDFSMQNFLAKNIQKIENNTINDRNKLKYNINFIISDGRFNKNNVKGLTAVAKEKGILYVFIIIDRYKFDDKNSILNTMTVKYDEKGEIEIEKYLSDFPFQYYTVVQDIEDLPEVLKGILVKWIETVSN